MRRAYCEITDPKHIGDILDTANVGRMATLDQQGYPYITPVNFVYYESCVYFHSGPKGEKLDNLARDNRVGFEADVPLAYLEVAFNAEKKPVQHAPALSVRDIARASPDRSGWRTENRRFERPGGQARKKQHVLAGSAGLTRLSGLPGG